MKGGEGGVANFPKSRENDGKNYKNKPFEGTIQYYKSAIKVNKYLRKLICFC